MLVTQVTSSNMPVMSVGNIAQEQLLQEFNFIRAKEITKFMLFKGLITDEEYQLIMLENIITFPTLLSPIIWLLCWYNFHTEQICYQNKGQRDLKIDCKNLKKRWYIWT